MKTENHFLCLGICFIGLVVFVMTGAFAQVSPGTASGGESKWVLVIHGGAGGPPKGTMRPEKEKQYTDSLNKALVIGSRILSSGGSSLDAVEAVIRFMEDCPLFNAGKGAVLTEDGIAELDASIMDGKTGKAGAVAGVTVIRNPIMAARAVMDSSPHVLLIGKGAESFARKQGLAMVDPSYFITPERFESWKSEKQKTRLPVPPRQDKDSAKKDHGTVGAVALDSRGNLAAGTSTGGMMMKMSGRVGDSPIIGAGTYADNNTCAVSCTGHGEYFIRYVAAYSVAVRMECMGMPLKAAADYVIFDKLKPLGGEGGLIAVDKYGNTAMPFSTNAMFRGTISEDGKAEVMIY
jgi:beta-aspartyl-peptidase (threonine type)